MRGEGKGRERGRKTLQSKTRRKGVRRKSKKKRRGGEGKREKRKERREKGVGRAVCEAVVVVAKVPVEDDMTLTAGVKLTERLEGHARRRPWPCSATRHLSGFECESRRRGTGRSGWRGREEGEVDGIMEGGWICGKEGGGEEDGWEEGRS